MEPSDAVLALSALAQETRLAVFRLLVRAGPEGLPASAVSDRLGVRANTLSTHLKVLAQARLVRFRRDGRQVIYAARLDVMEALIAHLVRDCCGGRPELCAPLAEMLQPAEVSR